MVQGNITMCGIICEICYCKQSSVLHDDKDLMKRIGRRGPDSNNFIQINLKDQYTVSFFGAVLWMQGQSLISQPVENDSGVLLFNGDIFDEKWDSKTSDTFTLMHKLSNSKDCEIIDVIRQLKGPFSIIYLCKKSQLLYFARDRIGRNSLLFHYDDNKIVISSVLAKTYSCVEISAQAIYSFNIASKETTNYTWNKFVTPTSFLFENMSFCKYQSVLEKHDEFLYKWESEVPFRDEEKVIPYIEKASSNIQDKAIFMEILLRNPTIKVIFDKVLGLLENSVKVRIQRQANKCKTCIKKKTICEHSAVGVLFSGGLDCTILAYLADKYVPENQSIDLMNVAFQKDNSVGYEVPDRLTGKQSLEELKKLCPKRQWIFREINVTKEELAQLRQNYIADLLSPLKTVLDENLGSALWFAARGQDDTGTSPCRVVLVGSGADELFGGYTRHRKMFKKWGWGGLRLELDYDWRRIASRNLARDNRIICDHGRQPRMPYLDDEFSEYVYLLKPWFKCFPTEQLGIGVGDKLMLRLLAFHLGLKQVSTFPKRALQFGSRIANKKDKGDDLSEIFK